MFHHYFYAFFYSFGAKDAMHKLFFLFLENPKPAIGYLALYR